MRIKKRNFKFSKFNSYFYIFYSPKDGRLANEMCFYAIT